MSPVSTFRRCYLFSSIRSNGILSELSFTRELHTRNYYDSLGLTPKASQADIKQAYYKLSLKYHPDKTTGEDEKFREINSAYEVLGNLKLRRLYDRGASQLGHSPSPESVKQDAHVNAAFVRNARQRAPSTGRTSVFNFDDWSKAHYGRLFVQDDLTKRKLAARERMKEDNSRRGRIEVIMILGLLFLGLGAGSSAMTYSSLQYDKPSKEH